MPEGLPEKSSSSELESLSSSDSCTTCTCPRSHLGVVAADAGAGMTSARTRRTMLAPRTIVACTMVLAEALLSRLLSLRGSRRIVSCESGRFECRSGDAGRTESSWKFIDAGEPEAGLLIPLAAAERSCIIPMSS